MLMVLSPSKTLELAAPHPVKKPTQPVFLKETEALVKTLRGYSEKELAKLMDISPKLAALNAERYCTFHTPFTPKNARPALYTFQGDVYAAMDIAHYSEAERAFAQTHLRILSGLYGLLRPLDLMQPYRLEMGTRLATRRGKDLYAFWGARISEALNGAMQAAGTDILLNLASEEYFAAVRPAAVNGRVVTVAFKERRGNKLQTIGLLAKKARGRMADWVIRQKITEIARIKRFQEDGYALDATLSSSDILTFVRDNAP